MGSTMSRSATATETKALPSSRSGESVFPSVGREFTLSDHEFDELRSLVREKTGISLAVSKREMIYRRLSGRLKALGIATFRNYCQHLRSGDENEIELFINSVTTNLTSFFRENHHFEYLISTVLPEIIARKGRGDRRLRIWSAGCSTGEEPYSLAIVLREAMPDLDRWDARILATDLDSDVLSKCRDGVYTQERVEKMSSRRLNRWFQKGKGDRENLVRINPELRSLITFKRLNLLDGWPMRGTFDIIFCRNVIIYFDKPTQKLVIDRYAKFVEAGSYLFLGHSESLFNVSDQFALIDKTIYRKR